MRAVRWCGCCGACACAMCAFAFPSALLGVGRVAGDGFCSQNPRTPGVPDQPTSLRLQVEVLPDGSMLGHAHPARHGNCFPVPSDSVAESLLSGNSQPTLGTARWRASRRRVSALGRHLIAALLRLEDALQQTAAVHHHHHHRA